MKILALDVSTNTGFAVLEDSNPVFISASGTIRLDKTKKEFGDYPLNFVYSSKSMVDRIVQEVHATEPDVVVIEETNGSRNRFVQKQLEFIHAFLIKSLYEDFGIIPIYVNTSDWRKILDIHMTNQDKKNNAKISKANRMGRKRSNEIKKTLGIKGKTTKKHLAVRFVNEQFNLDLKMKNNDEAEAICLGLAYLKGVKHSNGE